MVITEMPDAKSARLRFSDVAARATAAAFSVETVAVVATRMAGARSRRRATSSVTDAMATLEGARERALATPITYAPRRGPLNSARDMPSVGVNATTDVQSEHASQAPPSLPVNPAEQKHSTLPAEDSEFAGHVLHAAAPPALLNVPAPHALHATPSSAAVYPATHVQSINSLLPAAELVCEGHAAQLTAPAVALYSAAKHALHATPADVPLYPAKHVQSVNASLPGEELVPAGHFEHSPAPVAALNIPASHALHAIPFEGAVCPATQMQSVSSLLPSDETVFEGHAAQFPAPAAALYVSASHALHGPPSCPAYPARQRPRHNRGTEGRLSPISPPASPRSSVSPRPSWPYLFFPQHLALPSSSSAHE